MHPLQCDASLPARADAPPVATPPDGMADYLAAVQLGYDAGIQEGVTRGLALADRHAYSDGYAAGYARRQAELDADAERYAAAVADLARLPERNRDDDRARRDRAMIAEGRRQERERYARELWDRAHRSAAA